MEVDEIRQRLRAGQLVTDAAFDVCLPPHARRHSARYWTSVGVAARVARWLEGLGVSTLLDVGSGAGKFCVVGALSTELSFTGIEHRLSLVGVAQSLAAQFGLTPRTAFVHGDLDTLDLRRFDALYFYNPFGENLANAGGWLDHSVEVSPTRFARDVAKAERLIGLMPVGMHIVTYNGCGARVPDSYDLVQAKPAGSNLLRLWRKARPLDRGGYWSEFDESTVLYSVKPVAAKSDERRRLGSVVRSRRKGESRPESGLRLVESSEEEGE